MRKYLFLLMMLPTVCFSKTSVWHISKDGSELYLGGTIHLLRKDDYPLPVEFNKAFKKSDTLVLETDLDAAKSPAFGQKVAQMFTYPPGQSLKNEIDQKTFNRLQKYLSDRKLPVEQFLSYKPAMLVMVMSVLELQKMGMVDIGVDEYFFNKAKKSGKHTAYLETVDQQLEYIRSMGAGDANDVIMSTIDDMSRLDEMLDVIKSSWLKGDEKKMADATLSDMMRDYPDLYEILLVKRNNNWIPQLERMMSNKKVELVLVGALHLVGEKGLLQQLREQGYVVRQFE